MNEDSLPLLVGVQGAISEVRNLADVFEVSCFGVNSASDEGIDDPFLEKGRVSMK